MLQFVFNVTFLSPAIFRPNELDRFQLHSVALLREFVDSNNIECDFRPCGGVYLEGEPGNETDADEKICIFPADDGA